jgi:trigger factor
MEKAGLDEGKLREELRPDAEVRVKGRLVLEKIAKDNGLEISEEELSEGFNKMAEATSHDPHELRRYYEANELLDTFRQRLLEEKALNYLVDGAKIKEVEKDRISNN